MTTIGVGAFWLKGVEQWQASVERKFL